MVSFKTISNFGDDWVSGKPFGAVIRELMPDFNVQWSKWTTDDTGENLRDVITEIDQVLQLQTFVDPEDFILGNEDVIYQYLHEILQRFDLFIFGPGVKSKVAIGQDVSFTAFIAHINSGYMDIEIVNPDGEEENYISQPEKTDENGNRTQRFLYTPEMEGDYKINIKFNQQEIKQSPFNVTADHTGSDLDKVAASGPGLEPQGNKVGHKTHFHIYTAALAEEEYGIEAGSGTVDCVILDPRGRRNSVKPHIKHEGEDKYLVEYTPIEEGLHSVNVFFVGHQIPQSPFGINVGPDCDAKQAYTTGRGVQVNGIRVGDNVDFTVHTKLAGTGDLTVVIKNPNNDTHKCQTLPEKDGVYRCFYSPDKCGSYKIEIKLNEEHILNSPFEVKVKPFISSTIRAFGPGLVSGIVNEKCVFIVETNFESGDIGFSIRGPSETQIECLDNGDSSATIVFVPKLPGEYAVHILCDDDNIAKSPFMVMVVPNTKMYDPNDIIILPEPTQIQINKEHVFFVEFSKPVSKSCFAVDCYDSNGASVLININQVDNIGARYRCSTTFTQPEIHKLLMSYYGVCIPQCPIDINVLDSPKPENVKIYGPCLESAVRNKQTYFIVDCKEAGTGDIEISIMDEKEHDVYFDTTDHEDGRIEISFTPITAGPLYKIQVYYASIQIPQSPININIKSDLDMKKVVIDNMRQYVFKEAFEKFLIDLRQLPNFQNIKVKVKITGPTRKLIGSIIKPHSEDGIYQCRYSPVIEGPHQIEVFCNDSSISPNKPYTVQVVSGYDPSRVTATGDGIESGGLEKKRSFTVDLEGAGQGGLSVAVEGPQRTEMKCVDNEDGTCLVSYYPIDEGEYRISVKFHDKDIPGSPFIINLTNNYPGRRLVISPLVEKIRAGTVYSFTVNTSKEPEKFDLNIEVLALSTYSTIPVQIKQQQQQHNNSDIYNISFTPTHSDKIELKINYGTYKAKNSPFFIMVLPKFEPEKIKLTCVAFNPIKGFLYVSNNPISLLVDLRESGRCPLNVILKNPENTDLKLKPIQNQPQVDMDEYKLTLNSIGCYQLVVQCDNINIGKSPYSITVLDELQDKTIRTDPSTNKEVSFILPTLNDDTTTELMYLSDKCHSELAEDDDDDDNDNGADRNNDALVNGDATSFSFSCTNDLSQQSFDNSLRINYNEFDDNKDRDINNSSNKDSKNPRKSRISLSSNMTDSLSQDKEDDEEEESNYDESKDDVYLENNLEEDRNMGIENTSKNNFQNSGEQIEKKRSIPNCDVNDSEKTDKLINQNKQLEKQNTNEESKKSPINRFEETVKSIDMNDNKENKKNIERSGLDDSSNQDIDDFKDDTNYSSTNLMDFTEALSEKTVREEDKDNSSPLQEAVVKENKIPGQNNELSEEPKDSLNEVSQLPKESVTENLEQKNIVKQDSIIITEPIENMFDLINVLKQQKSLASNNSEEEVINNNRKLSKESAKDDEVKKSENKENLKKEESEEQSQYHLKYTLPKNDGVIKATLQGPQQTAIVPDIEVNCDDNSQLHLYFPCSVFGEYKLELSYNSASPVTPAPKSLFQLNIEENQPISQITAHGEGLQFAVAHFYSSFSIGLANIVLNDLAVIVTGPLQCRSMVASGIINDVMEVSYLVTEEGQYFIHIKYMGDEITGSPFVVQCEKCPIQYSTMRLETVSEIPIRPHKSYKHKLSILAISPTNTRYIWRCSETDSGYLGVIVRPKEIGKHLLIPCVGHKKLSNKPYSLLVSQHNLPHVDEIKVVQYPPKNVEVNQMFQFELDPNSAGYGDLEILIEGPSKAEINNNMDSDNIENTLINDNNNHGNDDEEHKQQLNNCIVDVQFDEVGVYSLYVFFDTHLVSGFPQIIHCNDTVNGLAGQSTVSEPVDLVPCPPYQPGVGIQLHWPIMGYNYQGNLQAKIKAPSGTVQYCDITDYDNQHFNVQFNPSEPGEHLISVKSGGSHVPGSPFKIYVDNVAQENVSGANNVQVYGSGLEGGFTNEECEFHVYTHNSGSGKLTVSIDGPSKAVLNLTEDENDNYKIQYHIDTKGEYLCSVKLNGDHINGSPFHLYMEDRMPVLNENTFYSANTSNVTLATTQNQGLSVGRQSSFMLHHKGLDGGAFQAFMLSPSGQRHNVNITHVGNGQFTVQLEPKEQGIHFIHVSLDNKPIAGSPFQVLVGEVMVQGSGLYHGQINTANSFSMDAKNTTSGPLTVTIDGPSKVELNCCQSDADSGVYEFTYIPNVPGEYIISIKYGHNQHIKGSPFKVNITGDTEDHRVTQHIQQNYVVSAQSHSSPHIAASCNVKCRGEGIRKAYIGRNNEFIIDASNAGNGVPYVAITGPHNPSEEINIRHVGSNRFQVTYFVREYGPHDILVRWGDIEVPGSPFRVYSF